MREPRTTAPAEAIHGQYGKLSVPPTYIRTYDSTYTQAYGLTDKFTNHQAEISNGKGKFSWIIARLGE